MNKVKQKTYFNILIFFSIVVTIFYIGNFYLIETVKSLSMEVVDKKQRIERLNEQSNQVDSIKIGYKYMQKEMDETSNLIVDYSNIIDFIIEIENIAEKSAVDLNINVSNKEKQYLKDDLFFVNYNIKVMGDFDNLLVNVDATIQNNLFVNNIIFTVIIMKIRQLSLFIFAVIIVSCSIKDNNPFLSDIFKRVGSVKERQEVIEETKSCIILATSGMLVGGPSVEYLKAFASHPNNSMVFSSYQGEGSLGRRIQNGHRVGR